LYCKPTESIRSTHSRALHRVTYLSVWAGLAIGAGYASAQATIEITEPKAGIVVNPGQTVDVEVSASGGSFSSVGIVAPGYVNRDYVLKSPPYRFSFTVPPIPSKGIAPGLEPIGAMGSTASGPVFAQVSIDIERPDSPRKITVDHSRLELPVGGKLPIAVFGTYGDGTEVNLSRSTETTYQPASAGVVTLGSEGQVTALAPGSTTIVVRHRDQQAVVRVDVTRRE
jgi:hypothetical protein